MKLFFSLFLAVFVLQPLLKAIPRPMMEEVSGGEEGDAAIFQATAVARSTAELRDRTQKWFNEPYQQRGSHVTAQDSSMAPSAFEKETRTPAQINKERVEEINGKIRFIDPQRDVTSSEMGLWETRHLQLLKQHLQIALGYRFQESTASSTGGHDAPDNVALAELAESTGEYYKYALQQKKLCNWPAAKLWREIADAHSNHLNSLREGRDSFFNEESIAAQIKAAEEASDNNPLTMTEVLLASARANRELGDIMKYGAMCEKFKKVKITSDENELDQLTDFSVVEQRVESQRNRGYEHLGVGSGVRNRYATGGLVIQQGLSNDRNSGLQEKGLEVQQYVAEIYEHLKKFDEQANKTENDLIRTYYTDAGDKLDALLKLFESSQLSQIKDSISLIMEYCQKALAAEEDLKWELQEYQERFKTSRYFVDHRAAWRRAMDNALMAGNGYHNNQSDVADQYQEAASLQHLAALEVVSDIDQNAGSCYVPGVSVPTKAYYYHAAADCRERLAEMMKQENRDHEQERRLSEQAESSQQRAESYNFSEELKRTYVPYQLKGCTVM